MGSFTQAPEPSERHIPEPDPGKKSRAAQSSAEGWRVAIQKLLLRDVIPEATARPGDEYSGLH